MKRSLLLVVIFLTVISGVWLIKQTQAQTGLPDLIIHSAALDAKAGKLRVEIKNQGAARAGAVGNFRAVKLAYFWENANEQKIGKAVEKLVPSLKSEASYTVIFNKKNFPITAIPKGAKSIRLKIDYADAVAEEDEENNVWLGKLVNNKTFTFSPVKPAVETAEENTNWENPTYETVCTENYSPVCGADGATYSNSCYATKAGARVAYVGTCAVSSESPESVENPTYRVTPNTEQNTAPTNPTTAPESVENPAYRAVPSEPETQTPAAEPEASAPVNSAPAAPTTPPVVKTAPDALPRANCMVSVETNPVSGGNYDLIIKDGSVYYKPVPAIAGKWLQFRGTIMNVGTESTGVKDPNSGYLKANIGDSDFYLCVDTNNDGRWDVVKTSYTNPLESEHYALKGVDWFEPIRGTFRYELCADGGNKVIETNENNNCHSGTITIQ
ncbi:MAG: CARDB domain-containing protein [Patescibacteria group bacterium]